MIIFKGVVHIFKDTVWGMRLPYLQHIALYLLHTLLYNFWSLKIKQLCYLDKLIPWLIFADQLIDWLSEWIERENGHTFYTFNRDFVYFLRFGDGVTVLSSSQISM